MQSCSGGAGPGGLRKTMSSGGKVGAAARSRLVIPSSVKKTIDAIKEITGHSIGEDEIYAMLRECSMDPNETTQKLLLLGELLLFLPPLFAFFFLYQWFCV